MNQSCAAELCVVANRVRVDIGVGAHELETHRRVDEPVPRSVAFAGLEGRLTGCR